MSVLAKAGVEGGDLAGVPVGPVSLARAEAVLRERFPQYAYSRYQLRRMCLNRVVPYMERPSGGRLRPTRYEVRIPLLLRAFRRMEVDC